MYLVDQETGTSFGLRPADGGEHRYYEVGLEHLVFDPDGMRIEVFSWARDRAGVKVANA